MTPDTLNPEIHATKIEIQNEIKSTEIKKSHDKCLTSVKIHEILKQENAEKHENNSEIINVTNVDTAVSNVQETRINAAVMNVYRLEKGDTNFRKAIHGYPGSKKPAVYTRHYWAQYNFGSSSESSPLSYDSDRNSFVAIVFAVTLIMLVITSWFVGYIYFTEDLRDYFLYNGRPLFYMGMVGLLILSYTPMSPCTRMPPCNIILLLLAVFFMSLMAAYLTARYRTDIIFLALVITAITVLVCFLLALTSFDFTSYLLYVIGISVAFTALVVILAIVSLTTEVRYPFLHMGILLVGTILNVVFLIIELQMILGGKSVEINENDWALAAYMLYTSIVSMFLKILQLTGALMDDD